MSLTIEQHASLKYSPRTWANAKRADLTMAFALNFTSAGEQLTRLAAGDKYAYCLMSCDPGSAAQLMGDWRASRTPNASINIAGNGMHTLARYIWTQERANDWVYRTLKVLHERAPIETIFCGGQSGADLAGAVAAVKLEIPCRVLMPHRYLQRDAGGTDREHSAEEIRDQIAAGAAQLC